MSEQSTEQRGPYLTPSRYLELERRFSAAEGRLNARIDELNRELITLKGAQVDTLRALTGALMTVLREQIGGTPTKPGGD